jgi:hypothetical protein
MQILHRRFTPVSDRKPPLVRHAWLDPPFAVRCFFSCCGEGRQPIISLLIVLTGGGGGRFAAAAEQRRRLLSTKRTGRPREGSTSTANRLATLGQITASGHEIHQPVAAIHLLLETGERLVERGTLTRPPPILPG